MGRAPRSIAELLDFAPGVLATYCSPATRYAWPSYDDDVRRQELHPVDALAPALLSYPIKGVYLQQMFQTGADGRALNEYGRLWEAMAALVADSAAHEVHFADLPPASLRDPTSVGWGGVLAAVDAVQHCRHLTSVAVTKILHRKLPHLVPVNDSRLRAFYGTEGRGYGALAEAIHADLLANSELLRPLADCYALADGTTMSLLRALDIVIWMSFERTSPDPVA